ncbi:transcriptional regulator, partial [Mycobacterium sp. ITM-2017-0098]
ILSTNVLAQELFSEFSIRDNLIRMIFLDAAATCCPDAWRAHARDAIACLRRGYRHSPADGARSGLVSELLRSSTPFRTMWPQRD